MPTEPDAAAFRWRFFRAGGFDQVRLDRAEDLLHLDQLDQKLWVALSCPTQGLEFDAHTLELIDSDRDGHVRAPELIAAVKWAGGLFKDPELLLRGVTTVPLDAIDTRNEAGGRILASARQVLANLGKPAADSISPEDTRDSERIFANSAFNGDGLISALSSADPELSKLIDEIAGCLGSAPDRSGLPGISEETIVRFFDGVDAYQAWRARASSDPALAPLGEATETAVAAFDALKAKIDDYFTRCRLAAYDPRAVPVLGGVEAEYLALARADLSGGNDALAALPLAVPAPGRALPLIDGLNPAWEAAMGTLRERVILPLLGERGTLTQSEWVTLRARFAASEAWSREQPDTPVANLGAERIAAIAGMHARAALLELVAADQALKDEAEAIADVDRMVHYARDLARLANNFVSFRDFYTGRGPAIFQAGTLYIDGRSCNLCVRVIDPSKHSLLAHLARVYLVYCECVRGAANMVIAAAVTAGDSDQLIVGRNGVFYDRQGRDWDATITRIIEHPIGVRQAFWGPYKRIGKMIGDQIQRFTAARAKAAEDSAAKGLIESGQKAAAAGAARPAAAAPPAPLPFDVAKFAGIFAAIGLAVGAIGTALATVVTGLFGLKAWQLPLAFAAIALAISGPSMLIAWFKLHQRNLAPILDANGWAINTRARINIPFGGSLTQVAKLPEGAERALVDPYAEKRQPWGWYFLIVLAALLALWAWRSGML